MICLRCGYCCHKYFVPIIDNPDKPISKDNVVIHMGDGPCKHLRGSKPGEYSCSVHSKPWYKKTPCFNYGQIESSPDTECRMGRYVLDNNITFDKKE